jgi:hypothetical protein
MKFRFSTETQFGFGHRPDPKSLTCEGGVSRMHNRLIHKTLNLIAYIPFQEWSSRERAIFGLFSSLAFFLGMERMLSDQALKQGRLEDALAHTGDEGRSTLR